MGGLGKTTLARQVFNHEDVKHQFDRLAWVCVSQEFTRISVWQTILQNLTSKGEILQMKEAELQGELFQLLETSKSLIIFDDIWKEEDWDRIKPIFPPTKGWKVLLTSRNESIVAPTNTKYINLKPKCLDTEDSWKLFQRTIEDALRFKIDEEMEEMGKQMIKHCGGLPLAIKVLGGMLAKKYRVQDWRRLSEDIGSCILRETSGNNGTTEYILSLSFEELPSHLKHCFLYLAQFSEDYKIEVEKLYYYWAAEGIFRHYNGELIIRDVGDLCIEELVTRNMVISERKATTLRFETCHLHDMMREICLLKAKEENFLHITNSRHPTTNFPSPVISRRIFSQHPTTLDVDRDINNPKLRSFVAVQLNNDGLGNWKLSCSSYKKLELLRVLDLFRAEFKGRKLLSSIGKLIHLRYLSLNYATVSHLPSSLGNLKLLIYLNLDIWVKIFVPNVLKGMQELRYLALPQTMHEKTKLELSNLVKLESLENVSTQSSSLEDLRGMVRLRTLKIKLYKETSMETLYASIGGMRYLETLSASIFGQRNLENRTIEDKANLMKGVWTVFDFVHLKNLSLELCMPRLSKDQHFPSHLTTLSLWHSHLEEDPMPILEKVVQLKEVRLSFGSFSGRRMVCSGSGFSQLHELTLCGLEEWEEWIVEEGSMPLLHFLMIWRCPKLKELPDGLRFLYSLKRVTLDQKWEESWSEGGEDYYKVKHIPFLEFIPTE